MQAVVRGVCSIIDAFRFDVSSQVPALLKGPGGQGQADGPGGQGQAKDPEGQGQADGPGGQGQAEDPEGQGSAEEGLQDQAEAESACRVEAESAHKEIQSALTRRVLPGLRAQLVHDGEVSSHI